MMLNPTVPHLVIAFQGFRTNRQSWLIAWREGIEASISRLSVSNESIRRETLFHGNGKSRTGSYWLDARGNGSTWTCTCMAKGFPYLASENLDTNYFTACQCTYGMSHSVSMFFFSNPHKNSTHFYIA